MILNPWGSLWFPSPNSMLSVVESVCLGAELSEASFTNPCEKISVS